MSNKNRSTFPLRYILSTLILFASITSSSAVELQRVCNDCQPPNWSFQDEGNDDFELNIIVYPPPSPIQWDTPGALVRSTVVNSTVKLTVFDNPKNPDQIPHLTFHPNPIGHTDIRLKCGSIVKYSGMSRKTPFAKFDKILLQGAGLEIMLDDFEGKMLTEDEIKKWIPVLARKDEVRIITFKISSANCQRLLRYFQEFKENNFDQIYGGLDNDPLKGEGAGCAAYSCSFLKVARIFGDELQKHWVRKINIPIRLLNSDTRKTEMGFYSYIFGSDGEWARMDEESIEVNFCDPELIFNWFNRVANKGEIEVTQVNGVPEIQFDFRMYPLPLNPIWNF